MTFGNSVLAQAEDSIAIAQKSTEKHLEMTREEIQNTYEDPGLAVGGGPEEMKEKQKKQLVWVIGGQV
jgi:hypothetical protein